VNVITLFFHASEAAKKNCRLVIRVLLSWYCQCQVVIIRFVNSSVMSLAHSPKGADFLALKIDGGGQGRWKESNDNDAVAIMYRINSVQLILMSHRLLQMQSAVWRAHGIFRHKSLFSFRCLDFL
jgi:hypothetical protein